MIEVSFNTRGDRGEYIGTQTIGYFNSKREAQRALRGLCPWDFDDMWGSFHYHHFDFTEKPGKLTSADKKFIDETNDSLSKARKHAKETLGSWHTRAPKDW